MFLFKLMSFLLGYVTILVTGDAPEKFINMAASRGISLWDVARSGEGGIRLKVRLSAVKPLRHMARRTRCRFRICRREGPLFILPACAGERHWRWGPSLRRCPLSPYFLCLVH